MYISVSGVHGISQSDIHSNRKVILKQKGCPFRTAFFVPIRSRVID